MQNSEIRQVIKTLVKSLKITVNNHKEILTSELGEETERYFQSFTYKGKEFFSYYPFQLLEQLKSIQNNSK